MMPTALVEKFGVDVMQREQLSLQNEFVFVCDFIISAQCKRPFHII